MRHAERDEVEVDPTPKKGVFGGTTKWQGARVRSEMTKQEQNETLNDEYKKMGVHQR